jgi:phage gpG-like protein
MSTNPGEILQQKMRDFVRRAPKIAGVYAVEHFRDNIRRRGGVPVNGNLDKFAPRKYDTAKTRGKKILLGTSNMVDSIRISSIQEGRVVFGISNREVAKYARLHLRGGTIRVTRKMKSYFWAMYYKSAEGIKTTKTGKVRNDQRNRQIVGDAGFYKAMALKKTGSKIVIPKREFMRITPDISKGILREFTHEIERIKREIRTA